MTRAKDNRTQLGAHSTTSITLYDGTVLPEIDQPMVEIVEMLNRPGLRTHMCCQGDYQINERLHHAWVQISSPLANLFCHRLLDDQLEKPAYMLLGHHLDEWISLEGAGGRVNICCSARHLKLVTERFRRVIAGLPEVTQS